MSTEPFQPITDLPSDWPRLQSIELRSLAETWQDQYEQLKESQALKKFNEKLVREWSIETGILERLYTIDIGVTQLLVEQGFDGALIPHGATNIPVSELIKIITAHRDTVEGLFSFVANREPLTISYVRQLHQALTKTQTYVEGVDQFGSSVRTVLQHGAWKTLPNNPTRPDGQIHTYCPPVHVQSEMEKLVNWFNQQKNVPPEIQAAWLHHRFTQIHPFQDGNGRVARALATLVFLRAGWFPIVIHRHQRPEYIEALEKADAGDLQSLVTLFSSIAKQAFATAFTLSEDVLQEKSNTPFVTQDLVKFYQQRPLDIEKRYRVVEQVAQILSHFTVGQLNHSVQTVKTSLPSSPLDLSVSNSNPQNAFYYTQQIIHTAKQLNYWVNITRHREWVRLYLFDALTNQRAHIVFSFHYLGKQNRGVMAISSFIYFPENKSTAALETEEPQFGETHHLCSEPYYFSYLDLPKIIEITKAYQNWLTEVLRVGFAEWMQRL